MPQNGGQNALPGDVCAFIRAVRLLADGHLPATEDFPMPFVNGAVLGDVLRMLAKIEQKYGVEQALSDVNNQRS